MFFRQTRIFVELISDKTTSRGSPGRIFPNVMPQLGTADGSAYDQVVISELALLYMTIISPLVDDVDMITSSRPPEVGLTLTASTSVAAPWLISVNSINCCVKLPLPLLSRRTSCGWPNVDRPVLAGDQGVLVAVAVEVRGGQAVGLAHAERDTSGGWEGAVAGIEEDRERGPE